MGLCNSLERKERIFRSACSRLRPAPAPALARLQLSPRAMQLSQPRQTRNSTYANGSWHFPSAGRVWLTVNPLANQTSNMPDRQWLRRSPHSTQARRHGRSRFVPSFHCRTKRMVGIRRYRSEDVRLLRGFERFCVAEPSQLLVSSGGTMRSKLSSILNLEWVGRECSSETQACLTSVIDVPSGHSRSGVAGDDDGRVGAQRGEISQSACAHVRRLDRALSRGGLTTAPAPRPATITKIENMTKSGPNILVVAFQEVAPLTVGLIRCHRTPSPGRLVRRSRDVLGGRPFAEFAICEYADAELKLEKRRDQSAPYGTEQRGI
jgi:hypothetical protein